MQIWVDVKVDALMIQPADAVFRDLFLAFLAEREARMGSEIGGLHAFYSRRLQLGRSFNEGEVAAADLVLHELPRYESYVEIGAGFGQLAAWLAIQGVRVVAVERDRGRFDGLIALRSHVLERWPEIAMRYSTVLSAFPCDLTGIDPGRTLILATNLIFGASRDVEQTIIEGICQYGGALIDTLRFCNDRTTAEEWTELDARFAAAGLSRQQQVWPGGADRGCGERLMWYRP